MNKTMCTKRSQFFAKLTLFSAALLMAAFLFQGCDLNKSDPKKEDFKTEYQGVLLVNGTGYFGKIEKIGPRFIEMTDVHYVHNQQNTETKEMQSILIKRGKEWHGPDRMHINLNQVVVIEPVAPDSRLANMIKEIKTKSDGAVKKP